VLAVLLRNTGSLGVGGLTAKHQVICVPPRGATGSSSAD